MKKIVIISLVVLVAIAVLFLSSQDKGEDGQYLKHFDGSDSGVLISCSANSDCVLQDRLASACGDFVSINKSNTSSSIDGWNKKENELLEGYDFDCMVPPETVDFVPVCADSVCAYEEREDVIAN